MFNKLLFLIACALIISSCAGVRVTRVSPDNQDEEGIRYYRPQPYLLITRTKDDSIKTTILWLPKMNEQYCISVKSGFGSVKTNFKLENGWNLTEFGQENEIKTGDIVSSISGLLGNILTTKGELKLDVEPGLYAFVFNEKTGVLERLEKIEIVNDTRKK